LKADQILAERSAIPAVSSHKRANENVTDGTVSKKPRLNKVSTKEYHRLRKLAYGGDSVHKDVVKADGDASYDPWETTVISQPKKQLETFVEDTKPAREPRSLKEPPISLAADGRQVKAVRKPTAEKSYNPTSEDWLRRFEREGKKEVDAEMKRLDEQAQEQLKREMVERAWEEEEREKEWESEFDSEWEGIVSEAEEVPEWLKKKRPERKTKVQRNKMIKRKEEERLKKHIEKEKLKKQQAERIKAINKQVKEQERLKQEKLAAKAAAPDAESSDDEEDVQLRRIQPFGKAKIGEAPLELMLLEELPDSLRTLRPEGNLLSDRYRSLLLRGKVESRPIRQASRKEQKFTEKWSFKDWKLK
jgi:nucleolar protein 53